MINLTNNEYLSEHLKAHAEGRNVLILAEVDCPFIPGLGGNKVTHRLEHRWLSMDPTATGDEVCCVQGSDITYWTKEELEEMGTLDEHSSLFDSFNCF